jgi:hypothetical protein
LKKRSFWKMGLPSAAALLADSDDHLIHTAP